MAKKLRVQLIHWKPAEAGPMVKALQAAGYAVDCQRLTPALGRALRENPPDAFVIDLSRSPSLGRDVVLSFRQAKSTRRAPLVILEGEPEKVEQIRKLLPDATFTRWTRIKTALKNAIAQAPLKPVVPASVMAGYSGTPLPKKLGIKPGFRVILYGAPDDFPETLGDLPEGAILDSRGTGNLYLWFIRSSDELYRHIDEMVDRIGECPLWIVWPKRASGLVTDLGQNVVRETALARDIVDYKVCAVDATWSGLLFKRRKTRR